jgi:uncharacterized protein YjbI with pentapeptide repeats
MHLEHLIEPLNVEHCNMKDSTFNDVNLGQASFTNVNLSGCRIDDVNLTGAVIRDANLSHVSIDEACVVGMTIRGILVTELLALHDAQQSPKES